MRISPNSSPSLSSQWSPEDQLLVNAARFFLLLYIAAKVTSIVFYILPIGLTNKQTPSKAVETQVQLCFDHKAQDIMYDVAYPT